MSCRQTECSTNIADALRHRTITLQGWRTACSGRLVGSAGWLYYVVTKWKANRLLGVSATQQALNLKSRQANINNTTLALTSHLSKYMHIKRLPPNVEKVKAKACSSPCLLPWICTILSSLCTGPVLQITVQSFLPCLLTHHLLAVHNTWQNHLQIC